MERRLVKALQDLSVQFDSTVRSSNGSVVQMRYRDDGVDQLEIEGPDGEPVDYESVLQGVICLLKDQNDPMLNPSELRQCIQEQVLVLRQDLLASFREF